MLEGLMVRVGRTRLVDLEGFAAVLARDWLPFMHKFDMLSETLHLTVRLVAIGPRARKQRAFRETLLQSRNESLGTHCFMLSKESF